MLRDLPKGVDVIPVVGAQSVFTMQPSDFIYILVNTEMLELCRTGIRDVVCFDLIYKVVEEQTVGKISMQGVACMDDRGMCRVPFAMFTSKANAELAFQGIAKYLSEKGLVVSMEAWFNEVIVLCDDGEDVHQSWNHICSLRISLPQSCDWLDRHKIEHRCTEEQVADLKDIVNEMLAVTLNERYWILYSELCHDF